MHANKQCSFFSSSAVKRAFLLKQNVTLATVLKTEPVAHRAVGCPYTEVIALCRALKAHPAGLMTLLLCLAKSPMSMIYLVQKLP